MANTWGSLCLGIALIMALFSHGIQQAGGLPRSQALTAARAGAGTGATTRTPVRYTLAVELKQGSKATVQEFSGLDTNPALLLPPDLRYPVRIAEPAHQNPGARILQGFDARAPPHSGQAVYL